MGVLVIIATKRPVQDEEVAYIVGCPVDAPSTLNQAQGDLEIEPALTRLGTAPAVGTQVAAVFVGRHIRTRWCAFMLTPPFVFVLFHALGDLWVGCEREWHFGDDQPFSQPSLEVKAFTDIGGDENQVISLGFEELVKGVLSPDSVAVVGDDSVAKSLGLEPLHDGLANGVGVREDDTSFVREPFHDGGDCLHLLGQGLLTTLE